MHHQKEKRGSNRAAPFYGFVGRKGHDEYEHIQKYGIDTFRTSKNGFFQMFKKAYLLELTEILIVFCFQAKGTI